MIFLCSQPDDTFFIWQLLTLSENFKQLGVPKDDVHFLVGYNNNINPEWDKYTDIIYANVHFIPDTRERKSYIPSIRPHITKKFMLQNQHLSLEYIFYHDSDILFTSLPFLEGMEDGRIHLSRCEYIDWNYINSKGSISLMRDLLSIVGIDEQTVRERVPNTGGAQFYAKGLSYDYWDKVEKECEDMFALYYKNHIIKTLTNDSDITRDVVVYDNLNIYRQEFNDYNQMVLDNHVANGGQVYDLPQYDFQIWTIDMWVMLWNQWLFGYDTYANPDLTFSWPNWIDSDWNKYHIFHNSGVMKQVAQFNETLEEAEERAKWNENYFYKEEWKSILPNKFDQPCLFAPNTTLRSCQWYYIRAIEETANKFWLKEKEFPDNSDIVEMIYLN